MKRIKTDKKIFQMKVQPRIAVIIEKSEGMLWGIVEGKGNFVPTPYGKTTDEVIDNLKQLITDYKRNEGKKDLFWSKVDVNDIQVEISYNLQAFFHEFDQIKISSIAADANLNPSLVRQYATGTKYASTDQTGKIQSAIHQLAKRLQKVMLSS